MVESGDSCELKFTYNEDHLSSRLTRLTFAVVLLAGLCIGLFVNKKDKLIHDELAFNGISLKYDQADKIRPPRTRRMQLVQEPCSLANTDLLLPLHRKDIPFAAPLFKSIEMNLPCYNDFVIVVPPDTLDELALVVPAWAKVFVVPEPLPEKYGYIGQQVIKMYADSFTTADYVFILEADMVFTEWKDECFFADSNRIKAYCVHFERDKVPKIWKKGTEHAIGKEIEHNCCVQTPFVFPKEMFPGLRDWITSHHNKSIEKFVEDYFEDMVRAWSDDKLLFSEFNIMNHYMLHFMPDRIQLVESRDDGWGVKGSCSSHTGQLVKRIPGLENPKLTNEYFALASEAVNYRVEHEKKSLDLTQ